MGTRVWSTINAEALLHNFHVVKSTAKDAQVLVMSKSNAYGHGLLEVADVLKDADGFGVHCIQEAIALRKTQPQARIVLMAGVLDLAELSLALQYQLETVVHRWEQIDFLSSISSHAKLPIWIKMNSGMNRLGFRLDESEAVYQRIAVLNCVASPIRWLTHFAQSGNIASTETAKQIQRFNHSLLGLPGERSLSNSAGVLAWPDAHADWVRPGIMIYGGSPLDHLSASECSLKPAMNLYSKIIAIINLKKGAFVGYDHSWQCYRDSRVGLVSIGYGDGYPRHAVSGTPVLVKNKRCPLIGRVSMDLIHIDLTNNYDANVGDNVLLWGDGLPIDEVARSASTIAYELMTHLSTRVPRQMQNSDYDEVSDDTER